MNLPHPFLLPDGIPAILLFCGRGAVSRLIRFQTRGEYSHAAILRPDGRIIESWMGDGVRVKRPKDWDCIDAFYVPDMTPEEGARAISYAQEQMGSKYDWLAVIRFVSRDRLPDAPTRWFCSELAFAAFSYAGHELFSRTAAYEVSPDLLKRSPLLKRAPRIK